MSSSKRQFAGRLWAGLEYIGSLFRGVGSVPPANPPTGDGWTAVDVGVTWTAVDPGNVWTAVDDRPA